MRKSKYNSFDELPLMLTVEDVSHVLGIGLAHAYEVAHRRDFPSSWLIKGNKKKGKAQSRRYQRQDTRINCDYTRLVL